jgi:hypothetical protein
MKSLIRIRKQFQATQPKACELARAPEVRAKRKASGKKAHQDPAKKARILAGVRTPECRKKKSESAKGRIWWHHPSLGKTVMLKAYEAPPEGFVRGRGPSTRK